jgi:hypothetical protein
MMRSPLFPVQTDDISPADFFRNYFCSQYDVCLEEAAAQDLLLDCSICKYKNSCSPDLDFNASLP